MPELNFKDLDTHLNDCKNNGFASVYLIYGEEYLYNKCLNLLIDNILAKETRSLNYEPVDANGNNYISELAASLTTLSFMSGAKVISLCDANLFHSKKNDEEILDKAKTFFEKDQKKKAARFLSDYLAVNSAGFKDVLTEKTKKKLSINEDDYHWVDTLASFCIDNGIDISEQKDASKILQDILEKGYPVNHHLIITSELTDKRKGLYKVIKEKGVILNCSVPKGDRKADKQVQESVLREAMNPILGASRKGIDGDAYGFLCEMTGFDLRTFTNNLEKLIHYIGNKDRISLADAKQLLNRTKTDPIYELTGAVAERRGQDALFVVRSLLDNSFAHLQILASVINQVRKLILAKDFIESPFGKQWNNAMSYQQFQNLNLISSMAEYDSSAEIFQNGWDGLFLNKKKSDLGLTQGSKSPYPLFLLLKNANRYKKDELNNAFKLLSNADIRLKSSGEDPTVVIEDTIIRICHSFQTQ